MRKITNGGFAVAEIVRLCNPQVLAMYPITPSTFIPEKLSEFKADGKLEGKVIRVESEFSAISAIAGASAAGVRTYTATASQGLALMHEVLYAVAGMRLPVVITNANRALSAPLNIHNDQQDSIAERDSGWLQIYVENSQEIVDTMPQAFKIAEKVKLPVMVCMDGFYLTHTYDVVDIPDDLKGFLPDYKPDIYLDPENPTTMGCWAMPEPYMELRHELDSAVNESIKEVKKVHDEYKKQFGRGYGDGLIDVYGKGDNVVVTMGSMSSNAKLAADELGFQVLRIRCYRPFPEEEVRKALEGKKNVIVMEKDIALGTKHGAVYNDIKPLTDAKCVNFIVGLGGVDVTIDYIKKAYKESEKMKDGEVRWQL